jgi:hypothetical protein
MVQVFFYYITWHYSTAIRDLLRTWSNFLWFFYTFFSIPLLLRTLFQPFHRLDEGYRKGFYPSDWAEQFGVNLLMRFVGAFLRIFLILLGLICLFGTLVGGALFFVAWLAAPLVVVALSIAGVTLIAAY